MKNISLDGFLSHWIILRSPVFAVPSQDQKNQKFFYLKLFPPLVFHSLIILFKSSLSDIILSTHIISSPAFYESCVSVSLFTHNFPFIQLTYQKNWITLIIKVVVSFGLQPENLLEELLSYLTCIWSWTQGQRISRLTSKLHPVCKQTALHCISCHGQSKLIVHLWCGYTQLLELPLDIFSEIIFLHNMHIIAWIRLSKWHTDDIEIPHTEICCVSKHW